MTSPGRHTFHAVPRYQEGDLKSYKRVISGTDVSVHGDSPVRHHNYVAGIVQDVTDKPHRVPEKNPSPIREIVSRPGFSPKPRAEFINPLISSKPITSLIEAVGISGENVVNSTENLQRELSHQDDIIEDLLAKIRAEEIRCEEFVKSTLIAKQRQQAAAFTERQCLRQIDRVRNEVLCLETRNSGMKKRIQTICAAIETDKKDMQSTVDQNKIEIQLCEALQEQIAAHKKQIVVEEQKKQDLLEKIRDVEKQRVIILQKLKAAERREEEVIRTVVDALVLVKQPLRENMGNRRRVATPAFKC